jgi:DNA repair protein RecN (Recombination protein N)
VPPAPSKVPANPKSRAAAAPAHLAELAVENLAVIERVRLPLQPGFVALTGETGVGKSILVDAVRLLAGGRGSADLIRQGAGRAVVEGLFRGLPAAARDLLEEAGATGERPDEAVVRRVLGRDGGGAAFVNDRRVGLGLLSALAAELVDIQGQHAQRSLLSETAHGPLLDGAGGLSAEVAAYREGFAALREIRAQIAAAEAGSQEAEARAAFLAFALDEVRAAALDPEADALLDDELARLAHAGELRGLADAAFQELYGESDAVLDRLGRVAERVEAMGALTAGPEETGRLLAEARVLLEEAAEGLRRFRDGTRPDPERQAEVEARLARIEGLKRKYGRTVAEVLATADAYAAELAERGDLGGRLEHLKAREAELLSDLSDRAGRLHAARREAAERLCRDAEGQLKRLAMPHARLTVELAPRREGIPAGERLLGPDGADRVRFLLAANPGEAPRPLAKVASGGELSRIMLALKRVLIDADPVPCLVFDEVDAGIGGAVAEQVGRMLQALGRGRHQVFCVTHLPQIATLADHHLRVTKATDGARTRTDVAVLEGPERVAEVARMLAGAEVTDTTVRHAREMLAAG